MFLCLHGVWQRFVCQMQIVTVLLEYKVEGGRTDTQGLFHAAMLRKSSNVFRILNEIWARVTGFYTRFGVLWLVSTHSEGFCYWFLPVMRALIVTDFYTRWGVLWLVSTHDGGLSTGFYTQWGILLLVSTHDEGLVTGFYAQWRALLLVSTHDEGFCYRFLHTMRGLVTGFYTQWRVLWLVSAHDEGSRLFQDLETFAQRVLGLQRDLDNSDVYNRECSISEAYLIIDNFSKRLVVLENEAQVTACWVG